MSADGDSSVLVVNSSTVIVGEYELKQTMGRSKHCKTKLAVHTRTGRAVCLKMYPLRELKKDARLRLAIERNITVLRHVEHPYVIQLADVFYSTTHLFVAHEFCSGGELFDAVEQSEEPLPLPVTARIFYQLMLAISFLHTEGTCHRDVKLENVLLDDTNTVKLRGFGSAAVSTRVSDNGSSPPRISFMFQEPAGSRHYAAPEVVSGEVYDGRAADVWSCGVLLFALATGRLPFDGETDADLFLCIATAKFSPASIGAFVSLPSALQDLLFSMLTVDVTSRISISKVLRHSFWANSPPRSVPRVPTDALTVDEGTIILGQVENATRQQQEPGYHEIELKRLAERTTRTDHADAKPKRTRKVGERSWV